MQRNTSQKQIILEYLQGVTSHPTAEEIYTNVKKRLPSISMGTVYRVLKKYSADNQVQEIISDKSHFDGDISDHPHLICKKCKKVFDVFDYHPKIKCPTKVKNGKIENYQIIFHGTCNNC